MTMPTITLRSCFFMSALLGACINTDPAVDVPVAPTIPTATVSGVVDLDNAIAGATVYIDLNDNNFPDDFEPSTTTDATGHFTLTWTNDWPVAPQMIGALVDSSSTRVGASGSAASVGFALHMRAPLAGATGSFVATAVISPLTTLVATEMDDGTPDQATAEVKIAGALSASQLPFSGQPLDVMADYASDYTTSADHAQLRYVAGVVASIISSAVDAGNAEESTIDCNDTEIFDPAIVAMDQQLTAIANGTFTFSQLTPAQQANVAQNADQYPNYFINTTALVDAIETELEKEAEDLAAELFEEIAAEFAEQLAEDAVETAAEELIEDI
jgi:hypothetical protein